MFTYILRVLHVGVCVCVLNAHLFSNEREGEREGEKEREKEYGFGRQGSGEDLGRV